MGVYDIYGNSLLTEEPKRFRILEYNLGNFANGNFTGYNGNDLDGYIAEWATFIGSQNADLCLFTETRKYIDSGNTTLANNALFSKLFNNTLDYYNITTGANIDTQGKVLLSQNEQTNTAKVTYTNQLSSHSAYVGALIKLNGVDVYVVSTHLVHGGETNYSTRAAQMAELVSAVSNYDNVIIGGDLNTHDLSYELSTLTDAGFTFANGGVFGTHSTYLTDPNAPLDNVGVRGNKLKLVGYKVLTDVTLSDHYPTITDILIG